ncbi:MAG: hypothetical protein [Bacteriophage sp.]|nr:MAG: hypothetical protein [Bacteriophage sp.]
MLDIGFKRATILSYDSASRTAQVHIHGLTDGSSSGLTATFAFPVGQDDRDTELKIIGNGSGNPDVFVFFENGEHESPVIAFFSSHGSGNVQDVRRIRQKNIELLAENDINIKATTVNITANVNFTGKTTFNGEIEQTSGTIKTPDVIVSGKSTKSHTHIDSKGGKTSDMQ